MIEAQLTGAVQLPDGSWIRGRGLRRPAPADTAEYGLYLGGAKLRRKAGDPAWPHDWIDWPDFLLPRDRGRAVELVKSLHEKAAGGARVEVACGGGVGRTGTVISCLAILAGIPAAEAVAWTRENYHPRAVETPWQRRWVRDFA